MCNTETMRPLVHKSLNKHRTLTHIIKNGAFISLIFALSIPIAACSNNENSLIKIHGLVTDVQARNLTEIEIFSVRDALGKNWIFTTDGPLETTPSHLRQHMMEGDPVEVIFRNGSVVPIAINILDYR